MPVGSLCLPPAACDPPACWSPPRCPPQALPPDCAGCCLSAGATPPPTPTRRPSLDQGEPDLQAMEAVPFEPYRNSTDEKWNFTTRWLLEPVPLRCGAASVGVWGCSLRFAGWCRGLGVGACACAQVAMRYGARRCWGLRVQGVCMGRTTAYGCAPASTPVRLYSFSMCLG